jgi:ketosteroid isomerase-like protein
MLLLVQMYTNKEDPMEPTTQQVFDHHLEALLRGDIAAVMSDYADDAVLMAIDRVYAGKAEILSFFANLATTMPNLTLQSTGLQVHGDMVLVSWTAESDTMCCPAGNDTLVIRDGQICAQTVWFTAVPK